MSRGPGRLQRRILALIRKPDTPTGAVLWAVARTDPQIAAGGSRGSFYRRFREAVRRLEQAGQIRRSTRRLVSIDEIVRFHPDRSRDPAVRQMRRRLLPVFAKFVTAARPRYGPIPSERYAFENTYLPIAEGDATVRLQTRRLRRSLEAAVVACIGTARPASRMPLVLVLGKLEEYLGSSRRIEVRAHLRGLLVTLCSQSKTDLALRPVLAPLSRLCDQILPTSIVQRANLKGMLAGHAELQRTLRAPQLSLTVKNLLYKARPMVVKHLPGHVARAVPATVPGPTGKGAMSFARLFTRASGPSHPPTVQQYSPMLDKLVGRDALSQFEFLSPPSLPRRERSQRRARRRG